MMRTVVDLAQPHHIANSATTPLAEYKMDSLKMRLLMVAVKERRDTIS